MVCKYYQATQAQSEIFGGDVVPWSKAGAIISSGPSDNKFVTSRAHSIRVKVAVVNALQAKFASRTAFTKSATLASEWIITVTMAVLFIQNAIMCKACFFLLLWVARVGPYYRVTYEVRYCESFKPCVARSSNVRIDEYCFESSYICLLVLIQCAGRLDR